MGFGPPTRAPFLFFEQQNLVEQWTNVVKLYKDIVITLDGNILLNMLTKNDDDNLFLVDRDSLNKPDAAERYIDKVIIPRCMPLMRKLLSPLFTIISKSTGSVVTYEKSKRFIELLPEQNIENSSFCFKKHHFFILFIASDASSPRLKEYALARRHVCKQSSHVRQLIRNRGVPQYFVKQLKRSLYNAFGSKDLYILTGDAMDMGEGEFACFKFLSAIKPVVSESPPSHPVSLLCSGNQRRRLFVIFSSDTDVIFYTLTAYSNPQYNNIDMIMIPPVTSVWRNTKLRNARETYHAINLRRFAEQTNIPFCRLKSYVFFMAILLGNDFLPSFVSTTVPFSILHDKVVQYSVESNRSCSLLETVDLLIWANNLKLLKQCVRTDSSINVRVNAINALHKVASLYVEYLASASTHYRDEMHLKIACSIPMYQMQIVTNNLLASVIPVTADYCASNAVENTLKEDDLLQKLTKGSTAKKSIIGNCVKQLHSPLIYVNIGEEFRGSLKKNGGGQIQAEFLDDVREKVTSSSNYRESIVTCLAKIDEQNAAETTLLKTACVETACGKMTCEEATCAATTRSLWSSFDEISDTSVVNGNHDNEYDIATHTCIIKKNQDCKIIKKKSWEAVCRFYQEPAFEYFNLLNGAISRNSWRLALEKIKKSLQ